MYDIQKIRADFPILSREVYGKPLVYLDNGATTQKPRCVVDAITDEYYSVNANVHRGVHFLSQQATELHEASRETVRKFINAGSINEIVFTRGTTESINLLASSFGEEFLSPGDEVIVSVMEHHSNIVPWQLLAERKCINLKVIPMNDRGELLMDEYEAGYILPKDATEDHPATLPADLEAIVWYMIAQQWAIIENDAAGLSAFSISDVSWTFDKNISETWQSVISKYQRW